MLKMLELLKKKEDLSPLREIREYTKKDIIKKKGSVYCTLNKSRRESFYIYNFLDEELYSVPQNEIVADFIIRSGFTLPYTIIKVVSEGKVDEVEKVTIYYRNFYNI